VLNEQPERVSSLSLRQARRLVSFVPGMPVPAEMAHIRFHVVTGGAVSQAHELGKVFVGMGDFPRKFTYL
jgi:hypothetical protein